MRSAGIDYLLSTHHASFVTGAALGTETRSRALVSDGATAENLYREAIDRLGRAGLRVDLARAHLLYDEWLRRQRRRRDARDQLGSAYEIFDSIGAAAFAERARTELRATGGHARERTVEARDALTAQEALIARLAGEGASNPEIAAQLFISRATVAYHPRKVFTKLGISSRNQIAPALPQDKAQHRRSPHKADSPGSYARRSGSSCGRTARHHEVASTFDQRNELMPAGHLPCWRADLPDLRAPTVGRKHPSAVQNGGLARGYHGLPAHRWQSRSQSSGQQPSRMFMHRQR